MSSAGTTLVVVFPGCAYLEIATAVAWQSDHGPVVFASPDGAAVRTGDGVRLEAELDFTRALEGSPRCVLVPGGDLEAVAHDLALVALLRAHAAREGVVLGGICNGALLLARAGLLDGRSCTHTAVDRYAPLPEWAELRAYAAPLLERTRYVDRPVVTDGRIVTAKPWAAIAFAAQLGVLLGTDTSIEAARRASYLRGERLGPSEEPLVRYAIHLRATEGAQLDRALVEAHVAFLRELDEDGALVLAGPIEGRAEGLVVVRASDLDEARRIAARDPFVVSGARSAEVLAWSISSEANGHMGVAATDR